MQDDRKDEGGHSAGHLKGLRILLVEDDAFIAIDCQEAMIDAGAVSVDVAKSKAVAMQLLTASEFDIAVIDIHLGNESGIPIAQAVSDRKLPFIFCTGEADGSSLPDSLKSVTIVSKPYNMEELILAIRSNSLKSPG